MKKTGFSLILILLTLLLVQQGMAATYLVSPFRADAVNIMDPNNPQESFSFNSGGLVDASGTASIVPLDSSGEPIYFTIGYPFAATAAFAADNSCGGPCADSAEQLVFSGNALIEEGAEYRYDPISGQNGIGADAWEICFTGVRDLSTGNLCLDSPIPAKEENFFDAPLLLAEQTFRAALAINPYNTDAAEGLLRTYYERMAPRVWAGNTSLILATRARLNGMTIEQELELRREAEGFFNQAMEIFIQATGLQYDISLLDTTASYVDMVRLQDESDPENLAIVPLLVDAYISALARRAETVEGIVKLEYLAAYDHPILSIDLAPERQAILDELNTYQSSITRQALMIAIFSDLESYVNSDIGMVSHILSGFSKLTTTITNGNLFFTIIRDSNGDVIGDQFADYTPEYVPFLFDPFQFPGYTNSFALLLDRAEDNGTTAQVFQDSANFEIREFDSNQDLLNQRFEEIRSTYFDELTLLTGQRNVDSLLVPDLWYFMLPPEERLLEYQYIGQGESKGTIYEQFRAIDMAETELDAALLDLGNIQKKMEKHEETARAIAGTLNNLAQLYTSNGEKLAAMEYQAGELVAARLRAEAKKKKKKGFFKAAIGVGKIAAAVYTGQMGLGGDGANDIYGAISDVRHAAAQGAKDEHTARVMAEIGAQKHRIRAMEQAQVQFQKRDELLLKTEEDIFGMMLDAERLKLNILIAEQRLDMEMAEIANLFGRVQYLLQEYGRATALLTSSSLANPHFRLVIDEEMRRANCMMDLTREKTYLAAMAAAYKTNAPENLSGTIESILEARNVEELTVIQIALEDLVANFYRENGTSTTEQRTLSLRHFIAQNNHVIKDTNGFVEWDNPDTLLQEFRDSDGNLISSDAHWLAFLQNCLVFNPQLYTYSLVIPFTTSLNFHHQPEAIDGSNPLGEQQRKNPLFDLNAIDMRIAWATGDTGRKGVIIDFRGPELVLSNTDDVKIDLRQQGTSYMRAAPWITDTSDSSLRVWNLEPTLGRVTGSVNGEVRSGTPAPNTPQFHERSPANDRWTLSLEPVQDANIALINNMDKITDIVLTFSVEIFTPN